MVGKSLILHLALFQNSAISVEITNRLQQIGLDAHWVRKNYTNHSGYKYNDCIDTKHDFIRRIVVNTVNIYDNYLWPDSAYSGKFASNYLLQRQQSIILLGLKFGLE